MTIKDIAEEYSVTQQAVYQKLKRKGIKRGDIQHEGSPDLTEEGEAIVRSLFEKTKEIKDVITQQALKASDLVQQLNETKKQLEQQTSETKRLNEEVSQHRQEIEQLKKQLKEVIEDRDFLRMTLSQTIEAHRITLAALQPAPQERGLLARIKTRFTKKEGERQ